MSDESVAEPVTVHYWASARAAAGTDQEQVPLSADSTLAEVRRVLVGRRGPGEAARFGQVLDCCSVLVGDRPVGGYDPDQVVVRPGDAIEFLPPFAGG